jgi:hypothetical protein
VVAGDGQTASLDVSATVEDSVTWDVEAESDLYMLENNDWRLIATDVRGASWFRSVQR